MISATHFVIVLIIQHCNMGHDKNNTKTTSSLCDPVECDKALCLVGYGKFHYEILIASALSIVSVGFQSGLSAYIFAAAQHELNLSSSQLGLLNVCFMVGGSLSSFLWGVLADTKGRKPILLSTHLLNAFITIICSLNNSTHSLVVCRFFNGFLIGAPGSIIFSYLAEFQPPKYRSAIICYSGLFFTSSLLFLPLTAWLILPINLFYSVGGFLTISSWRLFMMIMVIPEIIVGLWFIWLPESPKYLVSRGELGQALTLLRTIFAKNSGLNGKEFPVRSLCREKNLDGLESNAGECRGKISRILCGIFCQLRKLFQPPFLFLTILTCTIMFTNMFGVFGLGLWLPELFARFERYQTLHPNSSVTVKQLITLANISANNTAQPYMDPTVIKSTITIGVTSLIGNAISGWLASRISLRTIILATMFIGGLSAASIYWLTSADQNLVVASIFQSAMVAANMTIGSVIVELFPTSISGMAISLAMCVGRLGGMFSNIVFGFLIDGRCEIPIFLVAAGGLIGAGLCVFIPVTNEKADDFNIRGHVTSTTYSTKL